MAMSTDRVHFTLDCALLGKTGYQELLYRCFGMEYNEYRDLYNKGVDLDIVCRPSQFARFIVLRETDYGMDTKHNLKNGIRDLGMRLVEAKPNNKIDVSRRSKG